MDLPTFEHNTDTEVLAAYDELAAAQAGECELSTLETLWMNMVEIMAPQLLA